MYIYIYIHKSMYVCFFGGPPCIYIFMGMSCIYAHVCSGTFLSWDMIPKNR